ncbi:gametocyte-specific factor 1-like, partial [Dipodomys spectabilis]|uniref:gametocyte-specific factor 1-like n=1 Tax=Dipodomys spectabilis TaxID=105255 RepID=UPI001C54199C
ESADPERLLPCPYDKGHKVMARRFPYHLVKCRKNHPDIAAKLATCPFNARHLVPRDEFRKHIANCVDKTCIEDFAVNFASDRAQERRSENTWQCPPCEEDWDKALRILSLVAIDMVWTRM